MTKGNNKVTLINECIIKASHDSSFPATTLPLSTCDLSVAAFPITFFYAYKPASPSPTNNNNVDDNRVSTIKSSLTQTLTHFFPFAGQADICAGHILCNNKGLRLLEASADFPLCTLDFYLLERVTEIVMLPIDHDFLVNVQVTTYACGSFTMAWTFDHVLCDVSGFAMFLSCFCKIGRAEVGRLPAVTTLTSSTTYSHDRSVLLLKRLGSSSRHTCRALVERAYAVMSEDEILDVPPDMPTSFEPKHVVYYIKGSSIDNLQCRASEIDGRPSTRFQALSAYIWKAMATALDGTKHDRCQMGWIVEGRRWWPGLGNNDAADKKVNFVGNLIVVTVAAEEKVKVLKEKTLANIASIASSSIHEACNQDYFMEVRDYTKCNYPNAVVPKVVLGLGVPGLLVNGLHNIPMMDTDFGFGRPSLCVALPILESYTAFYLNVVSTGRRDRSWFVYAMLWPELANVLESDSEQIFCPITSDFIFEV